MACLLYNTGKCLQLLLFNRPNFGVHFSTWHQQPSANVRCQVPVPMAGVADFSRKLVNITLFLFSVKKNEFFFWLLRFLQ